MERQIRIRTPDKKTIFGTLNGTSKDRLIIFVHGLTGHQNEHLFYNAARFFPKHGHSTFRFDLYSFDKKARKLHDTTILTHANDVNTVVEYFRRKFKRIYLVGHSLGGPSILLSKPKDIAGIILWDPSVGRHDIEGRYDKALDKYVLNWGAHTIMGKEMYRQWRRLPDQPALAASTNVPLRVILAGKGTLRKHWMRFRDRVIISDASHCFDEEGTEVQLFKHTLAFIDSKK